MTADINQLETDKQKLISARQTVIDLYGGEDAEVLEQTKVKAKPAKPAKIKEAGAIKAGTILDRILETAKGLTSPFSAEQLSVKLDPARNDASLSSKVIGTALWRLTGMEKVVKTGKDGKSNLYTLAK